MPKEKLQKEEPSKEVQIINSWKNSGFPDHMMKDAFAALSLAILGEFWLSGDTKALIFYAMIGNLEKMGYSEEELNNFKEAVNKAYKTFHKPNSFMG